MFFSNSAPNNCRTASSKNSPLFVKFVMSELHMFNTFFRWSLEISRQNFPLLRVCLWPWLWHAFLTGSLIRSTSSSVMICSRGREMSCEYTWSCNSYLLLFFYYFSIINFSWYNVSRMIACSSAPPKLNISSSFGVCVWRLVPHNFGDPIKKRMRSYILNWINVIKQKHAIIILSRGIDNSKKGRCNLYNR